MNNLAALPALIPLLTALLIMAMRGRDRARDAVALGSGVALLVTALGLLLATGSGMILVLPLGSWTPGVGVVWVVDRLSAIMLTLTALSSLATLVYARPTLSDDASRRWYPPLHQLLVLGVNGSFITGDLFNLFVFFEVMLVASFVLISLGSRPRQLREAFTYVVLNLLASALLLGGVGLVYASAGTVNMAALAAQVTGHADGAYWAGVVLVLAVFAIKAGVAPLFFWLPDSYPQAALPVSAFFAGLLTKVGVYALFRGYSVLVGFQAPALQQVLLFLSALTMLLGVLGALGRSDIRGILSFHIISQVGYMVFGLALFTPLGLAAGLFYVIHHIVVKSALFLSGGIAERIGRDGRLGSVSGLARGHPWLAVAFLIPALSLAGIPPLSGFWGKLFLIVAGFREGAYVETAVAILVSLLTLASMLKIWSACFWGEPAGQMDHAAGRNPRTLAPPLALGLLSIAIGLGSSRLWPYVHHTAHDLLVPTAYVRAVAAEGALHGPGTEIRR